jgi:hypothetical protein
MRREENCAAAIGHRKRGNNTAPVNHDCLQSTVTKRESVVVSVARMKMYPCEFKDERAKEELQHAQANLR